eukprot:632957-Pyramimonas_sp.AAC.1
MATDIFNIAFASIQTDMEDEMEDRGLKWYPQVNLEVFSHIVEDKDATISVSFVDDRTPSVANEEPLCLVQDLSE